MKENLKKITILIPCHNEETGITHVIKGVPVEQLRYFGFITEVIVIDNNSTDDTASVARSAGATVIHEAQKGKGNAIRTGFKAVSDDTEFVIMLDGDNTYKPAEILRLIEPLASGFCDVVVGSRLGGKTAKGALKFQNRVVNWGFAFLVRQLYQVNVTDVLSGFFAWKKEVINVIRPQLSSEGFSVEMELITKIGKSGFSIYSVPITYDVRKGETKISPFRDGASILITLLKNLTWKPAGNVRKVEGVVAPNKS